MCTVHAFKIYSRLDIIFKKVIFLDFALHGDKTLSMCLNNIHQGFLFSYILRQFFSYNNGINDILFLQTDRDCIGYEPSFLLAFTFSPPNQGCQCISDFFFLYLSYHLHPPTAFVTLQILFISKFENGSPCK